MTDDETEKTQHPDSAAESGEDPFEESDGDPFGESDEDPFEESGGEPFGEFEAAVGNRQGDPFDRLGGTDRATDATESEETTGTDTPATDEASEWTFGSADPVEKARSSDELPRQDSEEGRPDAVASSREQADESTSLSDISQLSSGLGDGVSQSASETPFSGREREGDPFEDIGGAFEQMDVGGVDPDSVWQDLAGAESRGSVSDAAGRTYTDVSKHSYCEQCPFFSEPPDIECHHDGTEIVEFLDMNTVRVIGCPIVTEREALENE